MICSIEISKEIILFIFKPKKGNSNHYLYTFPERKREGGGRHLYSSHWLHQVVGESVKFDRVLISRQARRLLSIL